MHLAAILFGLFISQFSEANLSDLAPCSPQSAQIDSEVYRCVDNDSQSEACLVISTRTSGRYAKLILSDFDSFENWVVESDREIRWSYLGGTGGCRPCYCKNTQEGMLLPASGELKYVASRICRGETASSETTESRRMIRSFSCRLDR